MMKKLSLCFTLLCLVAAGQAQDNSIGSSGYYAELGSGIGGSLNNSKTTLAVRDIIITNGYDLNDKFSVKFPLTLSTGMFETGNEKQHETNLSIGSGVGYNFAMKADYRWQVAVEAGEILGKDAAWNYFYYDAGGKCYLGARENRINGILGLSVRQFFPNAKGSPNYLTLYLTIGFRINN